VGGNLTCEAFATTIFNEFTTPIQCFSFISSFSTFVFNATMAPDRVDPALYHVISTSLVTPQLFFTRVRIVESYTVNTCVIFLDLSVQMIQSGTMLQISANWYFFLLFFLILVLFC
jgi:hypothetical protein